MDCHDARLLLAFVRPGRKELEADDALALQQHLESCPDCGVLARHESQADAALARAMRDVPVPADLQAKLVASLALKGRVPVGPSLAAAAVVLLSVGVCVWWYGRPAAVHIEKFAEFVVYQPNYSPADVENYFADHGLPMIAPTRFNFNYLESFDVAPFQGRRVPKLNFFIRGDGAGPSAVAHVYVLSESQFEWSDDLPKRIPKGGSIHSVDAERYAPGYFCIIVYTGNSPGPFLKEGV